MNSILRPTRFLAFVAAMAGLAGPLQAATIVEFYNKDLDHYFITGYAPEIQALDGGVQKGWSRTGYSFETFDAGAAMLATSSPICRFYGNPAKGLDSHFYSASPLECDDVKKKFPTEWLLEAEDLFRVHPVNVNTGACPAGTKAVYRLYNKRADVNHRYTTDAAIADAMLAKGYVLEGNGNPARPVAFCAKDAPPPPPAAGTPSCTITSSTAFPVIGVPVTLTANCTGTPTSYAWINCTGSGKTCTASASVIGSVSYGVVATNGTGPGAQASISLNWQGVATGAPACTVSASTATPTLGSALTLTSNCSQSPTRFDWMGCSPLFIDICTLLSECANTSSTCSPIGTQIGPVYYALRASNNAGTSVKSGVSVDWRSGGGTTPTPPVGNTPFCSISASSAAPSVNSTLTLTAACTNSPTSFVWAGCTSSTNVCTTTQAAPGSRSYSVTGLNASGEGPPSTITVSWQQPPTAPPTCTLTASSPTPYVNGTVTLTASCTQSPQSWQWSVPSCSSSSATCQATSAVTGAASYTVAATNSIGAGTQSQPVTVTWTTPPPAGADYCGAYGDVVEFALPWPTPSSPNGTVLTSAVGGMRPTTILVGRLTIPAGANVTGTGQVRFVEYVDGQAQRQMTVSTSKCDFRGFVPGSASPTDPTGTNYPMTWSNDINPAINFGSTTSARLQAGQTYYFNLRNVNWVNGTGSCSTGTCNGRFQVATP
jgi:hypothetical protein